jgi:hypothetical protein
MRVLIALARFMLGGTETYSVTVAEQLEQLGHSTTLLAAEASPAGRALAASRSVALSVGEPAELDAFDVALVQDAASAYMLASRRPDLRQVFVMHGLVAYEHPPAGLDPPPTVVVLNDRIGRHVAALASRPPTVRMRQPIDLERFRPRGGSSRRARRVLLLSNYLNGARLRMLEEACGDLGLELTRIGGAAGQIADPQAEMAAADIVVGYGRSVIESMAMGRAAYVWDRGGGDGWVTPESYAAIEADGFSGAATGAVVDAERLRADLSGYRPELGAHGFDLVRMHHSAAKHTEALISLLDEASAPGGGDSLDTLSRLVRLECRTAVRAERLEAESAHMREELESVREREAAAERKASSEGARRAGEEHRRIEAERVLDSVLRSRSWRLAAPLRRIGAALRELRSRGAAGRR